MGQAKNKRYQCPAVNAPIPPLECISQRVNHRECPLDCPHNPWNIANADKAAEIRKSAGMKWSDRFITWHQGDRRLREIVELDESPLKKFNKFYDDLFHSTEGGNFFGQWLDAGGTGLTNDEKVMIRGLCEEPWLALFEILQTTNGGWRLIRNRFSPDSPPVWIHDAEIATAERFACGLTWLYRLPGRLERFGPILWISIQEGLDPEEVLEGAAQQENGLSGGKTIVDWTRANLLILERVFEAIEIRLHGPLLGDGTEYIAHYLCQSDADADELFDVLSEDEDLQTLEDEGSVYEWSWQETADLPVPGWHRVPALGETAELCRVQMRGRAVLLATAYKELLPELIQLFHDKLEDLAVFVAQITDIDKNGKGISESVHLARHLPVFPKEMFFFADNGKPQQEAFYRQWVDTPCGRLYGQTPRQAATMTELRPVLIRIVKSMIYWSDHYRLFNDERQDDCSWLIPKLGLRELEFPNVPTTSCR
jgi:hypothetical protein